MDISALITPPVAGTPATGNSAAATPDTPAAPFAQQLQNAQRPAQTQPQTEDAAPQVALPTGLEETAGLMQDKFGQALELDTDVLADKTPDETLAQLLAQVGMITPVPAQQPQQTMGATLAAEQATLPTAVANTLPTATESLPTEMIEVAEQTALPTLALDNDDSSRDTLADMLPLNTPRTKSADSNAALEPQTNLHSAAQLNTDAAGLVATDDATLAAEAASQPAIDVSKDNSAPASTRADAMNISNTNATTTSNSLGNTNPASATQNSNAVLSAPLASPQWQRGLEQHVLSLHQRGTQHMELRLHPEELGPLAISLKLGDNGAQAQFVSANPHVRAAVEQALPQLRESLAEQGILLSDASVGEHTQQAPQDQQANDGQPRFASMVGNTENASESLEIPVARTVQLDGRVDLYA